MPSTKLSGTCNTQTGNKGLSRDRLPPYIPRRLWLALSRPYNHNPRISHRRLHMPRRPAETTIAKLIAQNNAGLDRLIDDVRTRGEIVAISKEVQPYVMFGGYRAMVTYIPKQ